ncbi:MAG TPA: glycerol-3-phosphate 1-O-acyltransferase PlsY [Gemmatimonadaceae bacterium]|nr:glycerol-3-phosphate 1-O-acyltransferase PlsY [Gemmatimonadaceae bacterium]
MHPLVSLALAYLIGSFPTAYLAGKAFGVDLRTVGSGNLGATNVLRTLGAKVAAPVFLLDVAKGALPVLLLPRYTATAYPSRWAMAFGLAAIAGHMRPIYLRGKGGGKGVATACGVFLALSPLPTLIALGVFAAVAAATGYVSLASVVAAAVLPVAVGMREGLRDPVFALSVLVSGLVIWMHRANMGRLRRGEEHSLRRKGPAVR